MVMIGVTGSLLCNFGLIRANFFITVIKIFDKFVRFSDWPDWFWNQFVLNRVYKEGRYSLNFSQLFRYLECLSRGPLRLVVSWRFFASDRNTTWKVDLDYEVGSTHCSQHSSLRRIHKSPSSSVFQLGWLPFRSSADFWSFLTLRTDCPRPPS